MSEYRYNGPRVRRTPQSVQAVRRRAAQLIEEITDREHSAAVARWAASDDGPYPDRSAIEQDAIREVEILCRGLDGWGAVDPVTVLGPAWVFTWPED